jgi:uncharacterized membrane protein
VTDALTTSDGAFALLTADKQATDAGTWTSLTKQDFTVEPGKRIEIPFKLTIPANASPGDHAAGIVASTTEQRQNPDGSRVNVDRRVGTRVYLRVDGPVRPAADLSAVDVEYQASGNPFARSDLTTTYTLRNTGNVRISGKVKIRARGPFGIGLGESDEIVVPELLPGAQVRLTGTVPAVASVGRFTGAVTVNLTSSEGQLPGTTRSATTWASPWGALAIAGLVVALAFGLVVWRRRARRGATGELRIPAGDEPQPS